MKYSSLILCVALINMLFVTDSKADLNYEQIKYIEVDSSAGKILISPIEINGPNESLIVPFTVYGVDEIPIVTVDSGNSLLNADVTEVFFEPGVRFSGWFKTSSFDRIVKVWINDTVIEY
jgi:hypothetical protein